MISSVTAIAPRFTFEDSLIEFEALFPAAPGEAFRTLFEEYADLRDKVETVAGIASGGLYDAAIDYFLRGNCERDRAGSSLVAERVFQRDGAVAALNASFWARALAETDVYQVMPQARRDEWDAAIRERKTPEFTEETVIATIGDLLASRGKFFAERVDGIFRALSGNHVTNSPKGFRQRMILEWMHNGWHVDSQRCGYVADLRSVVAKFMGREEPPWGSSSRIVEIARERTGQWMDVDGGALRIRVYKKGTAHLEIHPSMGWRLNAVLASLYPRCIPAEWRTRQSRPAEDFRPIQRPLPAPLLEMLAELRYDRSRTGQYERQYPYASFAKPLRREFEALLAGLGATVDSKAMLIRFPYPCDDVLAELLTAGCIPDRVSHQYYPTPPAVAREAVEMSRPVPRALYLEPSAGQGGLADLMPPGGLCVEIAPLHCRILEAKGHRVVEGDFLPWSAATRLRFDRVVMNPPFSDGRALLHLRAAAGLLKPHGRIAAILSASQRGKRLLGEDFGAPEWSEAFEDEFDGTGVSVAIMAADKEKGG